MTTLDAETTERLRRYLARRLAYLQDDVDNQRRTLLAARDRLRAAVEHATAAADGEYYEPAGLVPRLAEADYAAGRLYQLHKQIDMIRGIAQITGLNVDEEP